MRDDYSYPDRVNADLWRGNRRRWKASTLLLAVGLVAAFVYAKLPHSGVTGRVLFAIFIVSYAAGMVGLQWARSESAFLSKPDRPDPPQLWKFRP